ncbi:MAG: hypothetical protein U0V48_12420 [Anaerolineales bacterium]
MKFTTRPSARRGPVGFEIGYNLQAPERLVLWEAQYGDFANNIQTVVDEFYFQGRAKWGLTPSLVLLLPHGNEGMGPDHSSARIERILNLAAAGNMRVAIPTTAAQYFHLLRRQALLLKTDPLPLTIFTPKGSCGIRSRLRPRINLQQDIGKRCSKSRQQSEKTKRSRI